MSAEAQAARDRETEHSYALQLAALQQMVVVVVFFFYSSPCQSSSSGAVMTARRSRGNRSGVPGPSWLIDGTLVVPDDAASDIGHAVGGRAGLDQ